MNKPIVVITGGSSGYGKAMATLFTNNGYRVVITARNLDRLSIAQREIGCDIYPMDVTQPKDWEKLHAWVIDHYGRIDILINNAGGGIAIKEVTDLTFIEINQTIMLNLNSAIYGAKIFSPLFKSQKSGTIINFASVCAKEAWPAWSVYAASKWGVLGFSKGLYTELQPHGIRVTCVIPAAASTDFQRSAGIGMINVAMHPEDVAQAVFDVCRLPAHVVVEEITIWGIDQVVVPL